MTLADGDRSVGRERGAESDRNQKDRDTNNIEKHIANRDRQTKARRHEAEKKTGWPRLRQWRGKLAGNFVLKIQTPSIIALRRGIGVGVTGVTGSHAIVAQ